MVPGTRINIYSYYRRTRRGPLVRDFRCTGTLVEKQPCLNSDDVWLVREDGRDGLYARTVYAKDII